MAGKTCRLVVSAALLWAAAASSAAFAQKAGGVLQMPVSEGGLASPTRNYTKPTCAAPSAINSRFNGWRMEEVWLDR